jgi:biopolymer transport protein ExbD
MALSLQNPDNEEDAWLAEINTTPLVDVMLVLLIIFLLTVPVVSASVQLKLPVQSAQQQDTNVDYVIISVNAKGEIFLNDSAMPNLQELSNQIAPLAASVPPVQLHVRADGQAPYSAVAPVIDIAQGFGFAQVSLLTEPSAAAAQKR